MTNEYQEFMSFLGGVSSSINKFASDLGSYASGVDRALDSASDAVRSGLRQAEVLLGFKTEIVPPPIIHQGLLQRTQTWISRNRAETAAIIAFLGSGALAYYCLRAQESRYIRKRRARKAKNGGRTEVIVIAGALNSPLVKSLFLDLERRGFIVYVIVTSIEEQSLIYGESKPDIHPLLINFDSSESAEYAVNNFGNLISKPHQAFPGASAHQLELSGLVIAPDLVYPTGAIQDLSPTTWSDTLSVKVLSTINVTHTFLPLLSRHQSRILILTPNIMHSLQPPQNSIESVSVSALETFTKTLRREAKALNVQVSHIKLGSIDFGTFPSQSSRSNPGEQIHDYRAVQKLKSAKGSSPRELHHAVFSALTMSKPFNTRHVGRGSLSYEIIGRIVPNSFIDWMLNSYQDRRTDMIPRSIEGWENVDRSSEEEE